MMNGAEQGGAATLARATPQMQRILVTGNAGAGKTSLARTLAVALNLPYVGLDSVVWKPGWVSTPKTERKAQESAIARQHVWVVDGVSGTILQEAETVIFLDVPRHTCFWRVFCEIFPICSGPDLNYQSDAQKLGSFRLW